MDVAREGGEPIQLRCAFLLLCSGYYDYAEGYIPPFAGRERFAGRLVHMVSRPSVDSTAAWLRRRFGPRLAHGVTRWKNLLFTMYIFRLCRRQPQRARAGMLKLVRHELGPDYDIATHFTPRYNPWQQRLCLVPDGDRCSRRF